MKTYFDGLCIGFIIGVLTIGLFATVIEGPSRAKCEENLPRSSKCVIVWVPEVKDVK